MNKKLITEAAIALLIAGGVLAVPAVSSAFKAPSVCTTATVVGSAITSGVACRVTRGVTDRRANSPIGGVPL